MCTERIIAFPARRRWSGFGTALLLFLLASPAVAQKTDVVEMGNGDRYTGEIKGYNEGRVSLDTSDAGIVSIKWNKILAVTSAKTFDVELTDGTHIYGSFAASTPPGKLVVVSEGVMRTFDFLEIVRFAPLRRTFWRRIDGSFDLGFTYTEANQFVQLNLNADATYRAKSFEVSAKLSAFLSKQEGATSSQRGSLFVEDVYFLKNRWLAVAVGNLERNRDLGLDLRASLGGGFGRYLFQTNQSSVVTLLAFTGNREDPVEGEATYNAEAILAVQYTTFMYDFPKLKIYASLQVIPSLSDPGRVRMQADASVQREIISDFYVSIRLFDSYDSRPPTAGASKNDWGPVISIGYKF
jgi:putative salt-induced outer membrane protein YdiY